MSDTSSPYDPTSYPTVPHSPAVDGPRPGGNTSGLEAGRYELLGELARGGMGVVYAARDRQFGRDVALKVIRDPHRQDPQAVRRFIAEARFTGRLQHPGVPPVHDLGELPDGSPYLAMKLVAGRTLARILADRPDPAADRGWLVAAFGQVCQAVGYAHGQGVVHRDLKPANVMVGAFGEVQVMDWGIAKDVRAAAAGPADPVATPARPVGGDPDATVVPAAAPSRPPDTPAPEATAAGAVLGTPAYMAPEQARGENGRVGPRADVFGLGAILCEILTGRPPFAGANSWVCMALAVTADLGPALDRLAGCGADPDLVALCRRCLAADPADRPADGGAVAAAVADYQAGVEGRLREAEREAERSAARAAEQRRRRRSERALGAAVGLILFGGGAFAWRQSEHAHRDREQKLEVGRLEARIEAADLRQALEHEQQASVERERHARVAHLTESLVARCRAAIEAGDADRAASLFDQARRQAAEGRPGDHRVALDRCRAELDLLTELDRIEQLRWTAKGNQFQKAAATAEAAAAFDRLGITPGRTPPAEAARRVVAMLARWRLVAELDWWLATTGRADVRDVLAAADPDGFRGEVRDKVAAGDWGAVGRLIAGPDAPAQPAWFAAVIGGLEGVPPSVRAAWLADAVRREPGDFAALMALGRLHQPDPAATAGTRARCCQAAVALRPRNAGAWHNLGTALRDGGDRAGAVAAFGEAVAIDKTFAAAHVNLGSALAAAGDWDGAMAAYAAARDAADDYAPAYHNIGAWLLARRVGVGPGRHSAVAAVDDALTLTLADWHYRRAADLDPAFAPALCGRGDVRMHCGNYKGAAAEYRRAAEADDKCVAARCGLGHAKLAEGDLEGAVEEYRHAARVAPRDAAASYHLGSTLLKLGARRKTGDPARGAIWSEASDRLRESFWLDPRHAAAHNDLGRLLAEQKEFGGAVEHFKQAARIDPGSAVYRDNVKRAEESMCQASKR